MLRSPPDSPARHRRRPRLPLSRSSPITRVTWRRGTLFFCVPGLKADGHDFARQAVAAGAVALVCERPLDLPVTQVVVPSARRAMALMAARWYGDPSAQLGSPPSPAPTARRRRRTSWPPSSPPPACRAALLGTVVNRIGGVDLPVKLTTAESLDLQRHVPAHGRRRRQGLRHGSVLARPWRLTVPTASHFDAVAVHQPHARPPRLPRRPRRLLPRQTAAVPAATASASRGAVAIVNTGDEFGRRLAADCRPHVRRRPVDVRRRPGLGLRSGATVVAQDIDLRADGSRSRSRSPRLGVEERIRLQAGGAVQC